MKSVIIREALDQNRKVDFRHFSKTSILLEETGERECSGAICLTFSRPGAKKTIFAEDEKTRKQEKRKKTREDENRHPRESCLDRELYV